VRVLSVRERDLLPFSGEGKITTEQERALVKIAPIMPRGALTWERSGVRVGPFCGVVRAGDLVLEILPKIEVGASVDVEARGVLVAMLRATGDLAVSATGTATLGLQRLHLLDVFILDFCARVTQLLRGGAIRSYEVYEDDLSAIRGRLRLVEQVRRTSAQQHRVRCAFDELTADNAHNRALKAVLTRLLRQAIGPAARAAVGALSHRLTEVPEAPCSAADIDRLAFNRLTEFWKPVFKCAGWFLRGLFPDVRAGDTEGLCLLFDMQRLFEGFVGACLRREWQVNGANSCIVLQGPSRHLAQSADGPAFRLQPDATAVTMTGSVERLFDAKWKRLDPRVAGLGVAREDAYQLAAYAGAYQCPSAALIYPRVLGLQAGLVEVFELRLPNSPQIEVYSLDLFAAASRQPLPLGLCPRT